MATLIIFADETFVLQVYLCCRISKKLFLISRFVVQNSELPFLAFLVCFFVFFLSTDKMKS
jgi:hypothetical protein